MAASFTSLSIVLQLWLFIHSQAMHSTVAKTCSYHKCRGRMHLGVCLSRC